ncbi:hypothetical protein SK128_028519 [Halocaridina rubra]|uniref:Phosphatidylcholine transfer protein n=1 Tax=Halocaridina rubra TaxID=373956 RepID=A0AAN8XGF4_HALRR
MQRGAAGARPIAKGLGVWGRASGHAFRTMTFRQLLSLYGRQFHGNSRHLWEGGTTGKILPCKRPPVCKTQLGTNSRSVNLLILLVGRGTHTKALEELRVLAELMQNLFRTVSRQCKLQTAERIRRGLQLYSVYSRLWGEEAAQAVLKSLRRTLLAKGRSFLLSAVCFTHYNWDSNKISNNSLKSAVRDLDSVSELCKATVECEDCGKRQVIDKQMVDIDYCMCEGELGYTDTSRVYEAWEPFIERSHHIVWRRRHRVHQHLFAYKVYGSYDDVSLSAFMEVQLNSGFRTEWDDTALQLRVLDSHKESNSDLIYWLVKYPQFFSNRDYIYKRRFYWNKDKQEVVIMSEAVDPAELVPEEKGVHRVKEYWSTMVIRAKDDANKPGLEYTLTYFDNPGTSLPQWLTNFIAVTGFPSFLEKVHNAAVNLQAIHSKGKDVYISLPDELRYARPILKKPDVKEVVVSDISPTEGMTLAIGEQLSETSPPNRDIIVTTYHSEASEHVDPIMEKESSSTLRRPNAMNSSMAEILNTEGDLSMKSEIVSESKTILGTETRELDFRECKEISETGEKVLEVHESQTTEKEKIPSNITLDTSLQVQRGNKTVLVDLLEAMEIVAPDLDKPTILSKSIEKLSQKAISELEKKTVLSDKLTKLRDRLRVFQRHALQKKEMSLQKMQELERRSRYDNYDAQTTILLDRLFEAMREVLQADKDMRTGKGLLNNCEDDVMDISESLESSSFLRTVKAMTNNGKSSEASPFDIATDSVSPKKTKGSENKCGTSEKKSEHKDDPPPPPSAPSPIAESSTYSNIPHETSANNKTASNKIETYHGMNKECGNCQCLEERQNTHEKGNIDKLTEADRGCEGNAKFDIHANTNSYAAQFWNLVSLGWVFSTSQESKERDILMEESRVPQPQNNGVQADVYAWYWYPVNGAYRLYVWAFKSSNANA